MANRADTMLTIYDGNEIIITTLKIKVVRVAVLGVLVLELQQFGC